MENQNPISTKEELFEYEIELFDNHMIALFPNDMRVLIDTGSPTTIANERLKIGSNQFSVDKDYYGLPVEKLSELVKYKFDCLLGIATMKEFLVEISLAEKKFRLHRRSNLQNVLKGDESTIKLVAPDSIPQVSVNIDGNQVMALIDTGAKVSYYLRHMNEEYGIVGEDADFFPSFGGWTTTLHAIPVTLGDTFIVKFGSLPAQLEMSILGGVRSAVIGVDLFKHYQRVLFDFPAAKMYLSKETNAE